MTTTRHAFCILVATGCAAPISTVRDDNRRLTLSVAELRTDHRAQDRKIRDLEHQLALAKEKATLADTPVPQLPVEIVAPPGIARTDGTRVVGIADDGGEIVYEGDAASGKAATFEEDPPPRRAPPHVDVSVTSDRLEVAHHIAARPPRAHVRDVAPPATDNAAADYRAAVELVKAGNQEQAIAALRAFLKRYPRHDFADNAQYWLGESFYAQKDYQHALVEFRATIETYPRGNKVPDALLKVGYCYSSLGQAEKARAVLEQVVSLYPRTEPAALAAKRLEPK